MEEASWTGSKERCCCCGRCFPALDGADKAMAALKARRDSERCEERATSLPRVCGGRGRERAVVS